MKNFEYENKSKLYFGSGSIKDLGNISSRHCGNASHTLSEKTRDRGSL